MLESLFNSTVSAAEWQWNFAHPYLYFWIKIGTPSVYAIILYVGFRIVTKVLSPKPRR
jgi:hypothetical protein